MQKVHGWIGLLALAALILGCETTDQRTARSQLEHSCQMRHSSLGRLSVLAETELTKLPEGKGEDSQGPGEGSFGKDLAVMVVLDKGNAKQWGGAAPSVAQVASVFEGLGKRDDLRIQSSKQDGRPGVIATTTALGWDKPQWTAIYFGANGLTVHANGHDDKPSTREACIQILRSIRFDP